MKRKTINKILSSVFNKWIVSIKDPNLRVLLRKNSIITGGSIVNMLMNEKPNDYDIYFKNKETVIEVTKYYLNQFNIKHSTNYRYEEMNDAISIFIKSDGVDGSVNIDETDTNDIDSKLKNIILDEAPDSSIEEKTEPIEKYTPVFLTSNAITLSNKIQLIIRFYGEIDEIHKNFDFVHVKNFWESSSEKLTLKAESLECIINKELKYEGSLYPLASLFRMRKFLNRGWNINVGEILKIAYQVSELNLKDISVLRQQLIGVDVTYFKLLIDALQNDKAEIEYNYLNTLINKIF